MYYHVYPWDYSQNYGFFGLFGKDLCAGRECVVSRRIINAHCRIVTCLCEDHIVYALFS